MGLPVQPDSGSAYGTGVFVNKVAIAEVHDMSGKKPDFLENTPDLWVQLKLDVGQDFQPEFNVFGDFKRDDQTRQIADWGSAFKIKNLFTNLGITGELNDDGSIPEEMLKQLPGKEFFRLQYVSRIKDDGKPGYSDWTDQIEATDPKRLANAFFKSVDRGYPKNYRPDLLDEDDATDFPPKEDTAKADFDDPVDEL